MSIKRHLQLFVVQMILHRRTMLSPLQRHSVRHLCPFECGIPVCYRATIAGNRDTKWCTMAVLSHHGWCNAIQRCFRLWHSDRNRRPIRCGELNGFPWLIEIGDTGGCRRHPGHRSNGKTMDEISNMMFVAMVEVKFVVSEWLAAASIFQGGAASHENDKFKC